FAVSVVEAERAARRVGALEGFLRKTRRCRNCQELVEVTWRVRPASTFLFWGRAARGGWPLTWGPRNGPHTPSVRRAPGNPGRASIPPRTPWPLTWGPRPGPHTPRGRS